MEKANVDLFNSDPQYVFYQIFRMSNVYEVLFQEGRKTLYMNGVGLPQAKVLNADEASKDQIRIFLAAFHEPLLNLNYEKPSLRIIYTSIGALKMRILGGPKLAISLKKQFPKPNGN